jgi:hypothetical protein
MYEVWKEKYEQEIQDPVEERGKKQWKRGEKD